MDTSKTFLIFQQKSQNIFFFCDSSEKKGNIDQLIFYFQVFPLIFRMLCEFYPWISEVNETPLKTNLKLLKLIS